MDIHIDFMTLETYKTPYDLIKSIATVNYDLKLNKDNKGHHKKYLKNKLYNELKLKSKYKKDILLANSESHRFAINYHKNLRGRNFLNKK